MSASDRWTPAAALEASQIPGSVALAAHGRVAQRALSAERAHASDLLPLVRELCAERQLEPRALRTLAVGTGPGSFTGLRVAAASALGLAHGSAMRLVGLPSCEALVYAQAQAGSELAWIADMRGGAFACARFARESADVRALEPLHLRDRADALDWIEALRARDAGLRVLGSAATAAALDARAALEIAPAPRADAVLALALARLERVGEAACGEIEPLYLREFGAPLRARDEPR